MPKAKRKGPDLEAPAAEGQAACTITGCKVGLWWVGAGARPIKCVRHSRGRKPVDPSKLVPVPLEASAKTARIQASAQRGGAAEVFQLSRPMLARRVALMLRLTSDAGEAAAMLGLDARDDIEAIIELAKSDGFAELRRGSMAAIATTASLVTQAFLERLLGSWASMPEPQIGAGLRVVNEIAKEVRAYESGYTEVTYSPRDFVLIDPADADRIRGELAETREETGGAAAPEEVH